MKRVGTMRGTRAVNQVGSDITFVAGERWPGLVNDFQRQGLQVMVMVQNRNEEDGDFANRLTSCRRRLARASRPWHCVAVLLDEG